MAVETKLDLDLLRVFLTIADVGSLSVAARRLRTSQPAVSQQLLRLETQLGQRLVNRAVRPVVLTHAGEFLARQLPDLLKPITALMLQVRHLDIEAPLVLRIVMPDSLCGVMGAEFLSSVGKMADSIELRSGMSPWIEESFRARKFDLGVDSSPFDPTTKADQRLLFDDPFVIVCPARHPGSDMAQIVELLPQVAYQRASKFGMRAALVAREMGVDSPARFTFDSTQPLLRFVQAGYGWAVTSGLCLFQSPAALEDIVIYPCRPEHVRSLFLLNHTGDMMDLADNAAQKMQNVFRELVLGPWAKLSPQVTGILRAANPALFDDVSGLAV
ncbi:MAG: LysR family transcriptional regulator [Cypionkella sp.]